MHVFIEYRNQTITLNRHYAWVAKGCKVYKSIPKGKDKMNVELSLTY